MRLRFASLPGRPWALTVLLCVFHGAAIWTAMGGLAGVSSPWPLLMADNGMHYHHAVLGSRFLGSSGATCGYDPSFMSGYAMSAVSDPSATPAIVATWAFGRSYAPVIYKSYALACVALAPVCVALAGLLWRLDSRAVGLSVLLYLAYFWGDFPLSYAALGMLAYLVAIPLGLVVASTLTGYLERGGAGRWLATAAGMAAVFLVHPTSGMVLGPAAALAYVVSPGAPSLRRGTLGSGAFPG